MPRSRILSPAPHGLGPAAPPPPRHERVTGGVSAQRHVTASPGSAAAAAAGQARSGQSPPVPPLLWIPVRPIPASAAALCPSAGPARRQTRGRRCWAHAAGAAGSSATGTAGAHGGRMHPGQEEPSREVTAGAVPWEVPQSCGSGLFWCCIADGD